VVVGGAPADKPARLVGAGEPILVTPARQWASRGALKLDAALTRWPITVAGRACLDAGASTGGFTDVLLERGARSVSAVDVGRGQLLERLRNDPRVTVFDGTNVRSVRAADVAGPFDVLVADLAFISLRTVAPVLAGELAVAGADLVWLVKPQFEVGRQVVARGRGVVREPAAWRDAIEGVGHALDQAGAAIMGAMSSPVRGTDGNVEFLVWAKAHAAGGTDPAGAASAALGDLALGDAPLGDAPPGDASTTDVVPAPPGIPGPQNRDGGSD
jgi:23S rRNA (cytidine1920-2'-O)/16S rRNA (cytidine1409-2'-O)-methyltransferase